MKTLDAMKIIDDGWIRRLKGFRVHFHAWKNSQWKPDCFPGEKAKPLTSEVSAWELARRFAEAGNPDSNALKDGDSTNIHVVDNMGNRVKFYGTGQFLVLNEMDIEAV